MPEPPEKPAPKDCLRKLAVTVLALFALLAAAPAASAAIVDADPNKVVPNPGWEVD
jgi:hypothetical protein